LPADELAKEKQVIVREMDMNVDDPHRRASRRLFETAYTRSPYRFTVIGYPDIFHELKSEDILGYYREKYAPNNVFYVVTGDVRHQEVVDQIRKSYSQTKAKPLPPVFLPDEPSQTAPREIIEEAPIELGHFHMAWHIPDLRHPDVPVLDVLALLLGHGRSSRLFQTVRESQGLAHSIDAWTYSPGAPGLFGISGVVDADKFLAARDSALVEIDKMKSEPVSQDELTKAVKQFVSATLASRKTMQGQAQDLGANWLAANDLNFSERYLAAIRTVTPGDLQRVARQYLTNENQTLYALLPAGAAPKPLTTTELTRESAIQKFSLPNGLRLLVKEDRRLPFVEFRTVFRGGVLAESADNNGLTQLMGHMLLKGTKTRSAEQIAREMESIGGSIDSFGGNNSFGVSAEVLSGDFSTGLNLVVDVLLNSTFPEQALEREREVQLAGIRSQKDQLLQSASRNMRRALFGDRGYGLDPLGTEETVTTLNAVNVCEFYRRLTTPNNCVLAIFGDVDAASVRKQVEDALGEWQCGEKAKSPAAPEPAPTIPKRIAETRDKKQAVLVVGCRGTTLYEPDRYALELVQEACSDLGSRLFMRIRETLSLAYYVGAQNFLGLTSGFFAFYAGTMPEKADLVEKELLKEAELLRADGLTEEELKRAKAKVIGQRKISRQDLGTLAMTTALDELYGLGYGYSDTEDALYEAVSLDQVKAAAQKYLQPDAFVVSIIEPPKSKKEG
jgi:zinc protease